MKISIGSGKGGVGKTFFTASLISLLSKKFDLIAMDGDVDTPNLALSLGITEFENKKSISISKIASINEKCVNCMRCVDVCNFNAIDPPHVNRFLCEGCGACKYVCPADAIEIKIRKTGEIKWTDTKYGKLVTAELELGQSGSGMLVDEEKKIVKSISNENSIAVVDVPAGISCTTISSIAGSDLFLGIVEPTAQSLSDLERMLKIVNHFGIEFYIIINKYDLNVPFSKKIENKYNVIGKIRFDENVPKSISMMKPMVECFPSSGASVDLSNTIENVRKIIESRFKFIPNK